jgi:hypothetical protein
MYIYSQLSLPKSELAGDTARIKQFGFVMNSIIIFRICISISAGWSPIGTRVRPGKSTNVKLSTKRILNINYILNELIKFNSLKILTMW